MVKKYKYEFYYRLDKAGLANDIENKEVKSDKYILMDFERNLPLTDEEYNIASKKLIDSVVNNYNVEKEYITPIDEKEYMKHSKMN
ncbi:hypothetical protein R9X47_03905 [Wukongibacter baidiensis]|uniref:hypothetical protein n=1 Tax=Wukongibacter baidiensis TaxID=1723361 RepID=UPI003D7FA7F5